MKRAQRLIEVSILLVVASVMACGPSGRKISAKKTGGGDNQQNSAKGNQMGTQLETALIADLKNKTSSKPTPEASFLALAEQAVKTYDKAAEKDKKQGEANEGLAKMFSNLVVDYPVKEGNVVHYRIANGDFVFSGNIDVKKSGSGGKLKAEKYPEGLANETVTVHFVEEQGQEAEEMWASEKPAAKPNVKVTTKPATKAQTRTIAPADRFFALVKCFNSECSQSLIRVVDAAKGFYPIFVRSMTSERGRKTVTANLVTPLSEKLKEIAKSKQLKIHENPGDNVKWAMEWTGSDFDVQIQHVLHLVPRTLDTELVVLTTEGKRTGIEHAETGLDLSNSSLQESLIKIIPKQ
jgi:hypothetical protein